MWVVDHNQQITAGEELVRLFWYVTNITVGMNGTRLGSESHPDWFQKGKFKKKIMKLKFMRWMDT